MNIRLTAKGAFAMDSKELNKLAQNLRSTAPLVGGMMRRSAVRKLAQDSGPETMEHLAWALGSPDPEVAQAATQALLNLGNAGSIDALCALWVKNRAPLVGQVIAQSRYVASAPVGVRVLSALQAGRPELAGESAEAVPDLVKALDEGEASMARAAAQAITMLKDQGAVDAFCALWVSKRDQRLGQIVAQQRYLASTPTSVRVLSALKADQLLVAGESAQAVPELVKALGDHDAQVAQAAAQAITMLKDQGAVDAFCAIWAKGRDERLGQALAQQGYVSQESLAMSLLTAFKAGRPSRPGADRIPHLQTHLDLCRDADPAVKATAQESLRGITDQAVIDALCEMAIADPHGQAAEIVRQHDYQPKSVGRRCLWFLLSGQTERFFVLDYELQYLRAEYQAADEDMKMRIGNLVRKSGDARLADLFHVGSQSTRRIKASEATQEEADISIEVYARNQQWETIFGLLEKVHLASAVKGLDALKAGGWRPAQADQAALLDEMLAARAAITRMPSKPVAPDVVLGGVIQGWIEQGYSGDMSRQAPDSLRQALRDGDPPSAVAALAALAKTGNLTPGDAQGAASHQHWLVRLACLALAKNVPGLGLPPRSPGNDGGSLWLEKLVPHLTHQAIHGHRAMNINPNGLEALQAALAADTTQKGEMRPWGVLLEAMVRYRLRYEIGVDDDMYIEVGETEVDIDD